MASVLHFRRQLCGLPVVREVPGISVRGFIVPDDVMPWLKLRDRAMAGETPRARAWSEVDFQLEMSGKRWWRTDRSWLAISENDQCLIGSVTLAMREGTCRVVPVVHWLVVDPEWRRRGIGKLLISHMECAAWNDGWREIELETHAGWTAAVAFYQSIGYEPVRDRSLR